MQTTLETLRHAYRIRLATAETELRTMQGMASQVQALSGRLGGGAAGQAAAEPHNDRAVHRFDHLHAGGVGRKAE